MEKMKNNSLHKLVFMFFLAFLFTCAIPTQVFAIESDSDSTIIVNMDDMKLIETLSDTTEGKPEFKGPAPGLSSVTIADYGYLPNGNFGVVVQVMGYGNPQTTTFNGRPCNLVGEQYITSGGNVIVGWFHTYDCGPVTQPGSYNFSTTYRSVVSPYGTITRNATFNFG